MNKIAYIFHGHSRTWDQCYENFFKNVYSQLPGDIFIHTWDKKNANQGSYWSPHGYSEILPNDLLEISNQTPDFKAIYEAYNPKVMIVEPDKKPDISILDGVNHNYNSSTLAHLGTKNMLYQSKSIFNIAKQYGNYDYYFSTRMDINYPVLITQEEISAMLSFNGITATWAREFEVSDIWVFGPSNEMNIKTDYFFNIDQFWFKRDYGLDIITYEQGLHQYLVETHNVPIRPSSLPCHMTRLF